MTKGDLIERYVHQVGLYLPRDERADIQAELASQLADEMDDRLGDTADTEALAHLLLQKGHPQQVARAYGGDQYWVGPDLYPIMMMVIQHGFLFVPISAGFLSLFMHLILDEPLSMPKIFGNTVLIVVFATLIFLGLVVLLFGLLQQTSFVMTTEQRSFDPLALPAIDHPRNIDHWEFAFGITFGLLFIVLFAYFALIGGLQIPFTSDAIIPVPTSWCMLACLAASTTLLIHLWVLHIGYWQASTWLLETILEVLGTICLYFVFYKPLFPYLIDTVPMLADLPYITYLPELFTILTAIATTITRGLRQVQLWQDKRPS